MGSRGDIVVRSELLISGLAVVVEVEALFAVKVQLPLELPFSMLSLVALVVMWEETSPFEKIPGPLQERFQ